MSLLDAVTPHHRAQPTSGSMTDRCRAHAFVREWPVRDQACQRCEAPVLRTTPDDSIVISSIVRPVLRALSKMTFCPGNFGEIYNILQATHNLLPTYRVLAPFRNLRASCLSPGLPILTPRAHRVWSVTVPAGNGRADQTPKRECGALLRRMYRASGPSLASRYRFVHSVSFLFFACISPAILLH